MQAQHKPVLFQSFRKIFSLLERRDLPRLAVVITLMIVSALSQAVGVASVMPFLAVLADPEVVDTNQWLRRLHELSGVGSRETFLYVLGSITFLAFLTGTTLQAITQWVVARFIMMRQYHLTRRLMHRYLTRPYVFFLSRNSGDLAKTLLQECQQAIMGALMPTMNLLIHLCVATALISLLVLTKPVLALAVGAGLCTIYLAIYLSASQWLMRMGKQRVQALQARFTAAAEAFAGAKEIRLLGRERDFLERYRKPSKAMAHYQANVTILENLPQYVVEALAFGGALLVVLFLMREGGLATVLPLIGLYALAGKQLIPAFQKIFAALTIIRFNLPSVETVLQDLGGPHDAPALPARHGTNPRLFPRAQFALEGVSYHYPGCAEPALQGIDLVLRANTSLGVVGRSGSGKSTLVDLILGLLEPDQGRLLVDETVLDSNNIPRWQDAIGYVPQAIFLSDDTIAANIALGVPAEAVDHAAVERAARVANLHDFVVNDLPLGYDTIIGERGVRLSGGQRQRIGIARALYNDPQVLIFDEATSALDNATEQAVMDAIHHLTGSKTIILVAHRLSTVRPCDEIVMLERGTIIERGSWDELTSREGAFRNLAEAP